MIEQWKPKKAGEEVFKEGRSGDVSAYTEYAQAIADEQVAFASEVLNLAPHEATWLRAGIREDLDRVSETVKHVAYTGDGLTPEKGGAFDEVRINASRLALWSVMERIGGIGATTQDALRVKDQAVALASFLAQKALVKQGVSVDPEVFKKVSALSGDDLATCILGDSKQEGLIETNDRSRSRIAAYPASAVLDAGVRNAGTIGALLANGGWNAVQPARAVAEKTETWIADEHEAYGSFAKMVTGIYSAVSPEKPRDVAFARAVYEVLKGILQVTKMVDARHLWKEGENKAVDLVKLRKGPNGWLVRVHKREEDGVLPPSMKPWALPGGFVEEDSDAEAAIREANEEHGEHTEGDVYECFPRQVVDDPRNIKDDRWISSHGFVQIVSSFADTDMSQEGEVAQGSKAWVPASELLRHHAMYGSHVEIVKAAIAKAESLNA